MTYPAKHIERRKRIFQETQPYPHPSKRMQYLDEFVLALAFIMPLVTLPQLFKIWIAKSVVGLSFLTWTLYFIFSIPMLIYGIAHKNKIITIMYILWVIIDGLVVLGMFIYA